MPPGDLTPLTPAIHSLTESRGVTLLNRHYWQSLSTPALVEMRWAWQLFLRTKALPYPIAAEAFGIKKGSKGIVTTVEGSSLRYALAGLKVLRAVGCVLDIEAWHYSGELTEAQKELVINYGTGSKGRGSIILREAVEQAKQLKEKLEAASTSGTGKRFPGTSLQQSTDNEDHFFQPKKSGRNYQLKVEAIMASSFESVLWLDSDNIAALDPTLLFDSPAYKSTGALFWPDYWKTAVDNPIWTIAGTSYRYEPEFEAGQMLISKPLAWCALSLALHFVHKQVYQDRFLWGDKDAFRYAWKATGTPYHAVRWHVAPAGPLTSRDPKDFCATTMVQFHPEDRDKPVFFHANALKYSSASAPKTETATIKPVIEPVEGDSGPFPYILRYSASTDERRMQPVGYKGSGGRWCVTLGGDSEAGIETEWLETDVKVGKLWMDAWKEVEAVKGI
jgi:hypothetical protein